MFEQWWSRIDAAAVPLLTQVTPFIPFVAADPYHEDPWFWHGGFGVGYHSHYHGW